MWVRQHAAGDELAELTGSARERRERGGAVEGAGVRWVVNGGKLVVTCAMGRAKVQGCGASKPSLSTQRESNQPP